MDDLVQTRERIGIAEDECGKGRAIEFTLGIDDGGTESIGNLGENG